MKKIAYLLLIALHMQMAAPALAENDRGTQMLEQQKQSAPIDVKMPPLTCPVDERKLNTDSGKKLDDILWAHKRAKLSTDYQKFVLSELNKEWIGYCKQKATATNVNALAMSLPGTKASGTGGCGELKDQITNLEGVEKQLDQHIYQIQKIRYENFEKYSKNQKLNLEEIENKAWKYCYPDSLSDACALKYRIRNEASSVWGKNYNFEKKEYSNSFFANYWRALDNEEADLQKKKQTIADAKKRASESCASLKSIDSNITPNSAPAVGAKLPKSTPTSSGSVTTGAGSGAPTPPANGGKSVDPALPKSTTPAGTYIDPNKLLTTATDPSAPDATDENKPPVGEGAAAPAEPIIPKDPGTPEQPVKDEEEGSSWGWLSSPWLWGGVGVLGGAGVTYWIMKKKLDKEKEKKKKAEEKAKAAAAAANTSTVGAPTVSGPGYSGEDPGTLSGCNLTVVGAPSAASVGVELPAIDVSIVNPNGTIPTSDNLTVVNVTCASCSLTGTKSITASAGVAKFTGLKFTYADKQVVLQFSGGPCNNASAAPFDVSDAGPRE